MYICHVLSDYRRVLDWQLRLLDHNVHFTIYYGTIHCLPSAESLLGWAQDLLHTQLTSLALLWRLPNSELNSATTAAINSYGITCNT
jgi:hypothetical protein